MRFHDFIRFTLRFCITWGHVCENWSQGFGLMAWYFFWAQVSILADFPILSQNAYKLTCCSEKNHLFIDVQSGCLTSFKKTLLTISSKSKNDLDVLKNICKQKKPPRVAFILVAILKLMYCQYKAPNWQYFNLGKSAWMYKSEAALQSCS